MSAVVVTSHPLAVKAGLEMRDAGGGAVDAAVAAAVVLAVVDPVSPGSTATSSVVAGARRPAAPQRPRFLGPRRSSMTRAEGRSANELTGSQSALSLSFAVASSSVARIIAATSSRWRSIALRAAFASRPVSAAMTACPSMAIIALGSGWHYRPDAAVLVGILRRQGVRCSSYAGFVQMPRWPYLRATPVASVAGAPPPSSAAVAAAT